METIHNILLEETAGIIKYRLGEEIEKVTVERAVFGLFFSGVRLSTGHGGLCFTPIKDIPEAVCCPSSAKAMPLSGKLTKRPVNAYLQDIQSPNPLKQTMAIAVLNALSGLCWEKEPPLDYEIEMDVDAFDDIPYGKYKKTVVIGALVPILKKLSQAKADYTVLEMDPRTLKGDELKHYQPADQAPQYVPDADLLVVTGVSILNNTLPDILAMAKKGAEIIVSGPTASMLPEAFFQRGVTVMGGIVVSDADKLLDIISEAGSGYHFFGKFAHRTVIRRKTRQE